MYWSSVVIVSNVMLIMFALGCAVVKYLCSTLHTHIKVIYPDYQFTKYTH